MNTLGQKNKIKIGILGPGAVGGLIGSLFWNKGYNVTCIGLEDFVNEINENGINFKSKKFGDYIAKPKAVTQLEESLDLIFVTVKATGLLDSLNKVPFECTNNTIFLPLLNGIEHIDILKNKYGDKIIAGAISVEASSPKPGYVEHRSPFVIIKIAHTGNLKKQTINEIDKLIQDTGIDTYILNSEKEVLWGKLVRLNALACTTASINKSIGWIRTDKKWRKILEGCAYEGSLVAQKEGVDIKYSEVMKQLDSLPFELTTSMQRDVAVGNIPELDAIPGAIIRIAKKYDLKCPNIEETVKIIKEKLCLK